MQGEPKKLIADHVLIDALRESPIAHAALEEAEARRLEHRQALVDKIARLREQAERTLPVLRSVAAAALKDLENAQQAVVEAKRKVAKAESDLSMASSTYHVDRLEAELRAGADPKIQGFIAKLSALDDEVRGEGYLREEFGPMNVVTGTKARTVTSNYPDVNARLLAIRQARRDAEALKLDVGRDIPERLQRLWKRVTA